MSNHFNVNTWAEVDRGRDRWAEIDRLRSKASLKRPTQHYDNASW